jgi:hypothetical protein
MFKFKLWLVSLIFLIPGCATPLQPMISISKSSEVESRVTLYDSIILDIVSPPEKGPSATALAFFINSLKQYDICDRVLVNYRTDITGILPIWDANLIRHFESVNRKLKDVDSNDRRLTLFICYLPGSYHSGKVNNIAGIQYNPTSFAIFRDKVRESFEGVVLLHEFGHIIRISRTANRKEPPINPDRPNHCNNKKCTMFWRARVDRTHLDAKCLKDLKKLIIAAN